MNATSVKARLRNFAEKSGKTFQEVLLYYGIERTIYRISVSEYTGHFTLKGGIFLYALFDRNYERATSDIDLLATKISNSTEEMKTVFQHIFAIEADDAIRYDLESISVKNIAEFKEYLGLNVSVFAYLDRTQIPVSIDVGFGDIVYPERIEMEFPVLLDMEAPRVYAYSVESVIAEKLEAIVSNGMMNSRYKDFYDIFVLSKRYRFESMRLADAITETFSRRGTALSKETSALGDEFLADSMHQTRWRSFVKKKKAMIPVQMDDAVSWLRAFIIPLIEKNSVGNQIWQPEIGLWK